MSIAELVSRLARLDVEMHQRDGRLKIDAPKGVLTQQLRSELVDRKQEILEFLAHNRTSGRPPPALRLERAPRSPGEALTLSFAQERLWFLDHLAAGRAAYNVPMIWSLRGPLDIRLLAASLCLIVRRHEILRARFEMGAGRPVQRIAAAVTVPLPRVDLRQLSAGRRWAEARRLAKAEAMRGFDLTHGQPLRSLLLELGDGSVQLLVTFHHLVVDGSSLGIFQRELQAFYRALAAGWRGAGHAAPLPEPLPEPALQYADYTLWQRRQIDDTAVDEQLDFWRHQLAGVATLELPRDGPRPALPTFGGHRLRFELAPALSEALQSLSRQHGATLFMALLASFAALLHRLTGSTDVAVGTPVAGRTRDELASLIGTFANTLVLRSDLTGDPSFVDLLGRARRTALAAFAHQDLPFEKLVEALRPERDPSHSPLFQAMLMIERAAPSLALGNGLEIGPSELWEHKGTADFDLTLTVREGTPALRCGLEYSTDLFAATTARRWAGHWRILVAAIVADPARPLSALPLLPAAERQQLLVEWNATRVPWPAAKSFPELFARRVACCGDACALESGDERLSYRELDRRASQLAHRLLELGVGPESRVGLALGRSAECLIAVLGILEAGAAYVPLDPSYPRERLQRMAEDARIAMLITEERQRGRWQGHGEPPSFPFICLERERGSASVRPAKRRQRDESLPGPIEPESAAYVIYTSGSTGDPKGVVISQRALAWYTLASIGHYGIVPEDRILQFTSLSFDISVEEIFPCLAAGATLVLRDEPMAVSTLEFTRRCRARAITALFLPTAFWHQLAAVLANEPSLLPETLRLVSFGGERVLPERIADWQQATAGQPAARRVRLLNGYGPTEATVVATLYELTSIAELTVPVAIGRPIARTRVWVLGRRLQPSPLGVHGELAIAGEGVARGYLRRPAATAERFVPDPFTGSPGQRLYRTGDLVRTLADGKVQTLGRIDRQIKIRGFRVEPAEIEGLLLSHPTLREAAVLAAPPGRLVAFAVPEEGHEPNPEAVRRWLLERLPEVMVPTRVFCLEALPETPNGKVDEQALRVFADRAFADRAPAPRDGPPSSAAGPLGNTEERAIAEAWRRVLGVETVGLDDNFFDVGGHSLLTLEVQQRLEETFGRSLPVVDLFRFPTIRTLATQLRGEVGQLHPSPSEAAPRELSSAIAIVGFAGRFPGARNVDELWRNLAAGVESIRHFDRQQLLDRGVPEGQIDHPDFVAAEGAMDGMELFDAAFFDIAPREAQILDPQQRHFLECAWEALEHAGYDPRRYDSAIGVFAGCGRNDYEWRATADPQIRAALSRYQIALANLADFLPTRVSYKLDLKGPSIAVQTACSTSLVAIHLACQSLLDGDCQMALAGGVSLFTRPPGYLYEPSGIFSPDGLCRAFDARAAGTVTGNGVGIVVLKPLADAVAEGDSIHAVIRGSAANNDGSLKAGFTAPGVEGQVAVIRAALRRAGIEPESIRYLEAHGTGTELGDPIEVAALNRVYAAEGNGGSCALGSVKTNLGHLDTAAGVTGLIKAVLTLKHRRIPPSLHFERPNPQIDFAASPFYVPTELTPWPAEGQPRRAAVSSFGLGGTNAHVVLEEAPRPSSQPPSQPEPALELLLLSARTAPALALASDRLADHLEAHPDLLLSDVAHTLRLGRRPLGHRRIVCCRDRQQAVAALRQPNAGRREAAVIDSQGPERPVAFLFPGQGAQYPGMAADLYAAEPLFRDTLDDASEILRSELDLHLGELILASAEDAEAQARMTTASCAHPALFAVEVGLAKIWRAWGVEPEAMLGYSLGEYVAAHLAGVFTFAEGLRLIATRGRLMESLPGGGMLAVGLSESEVSRRLQQPDLRELSLAAINAADACVVSGPSGAIATLARRLEDEAVELQHVRASHAFHSPMMEPILEPFGAALTTIDLRPPQIPYLSSRTGTWIRPEEATDPRYWAECLRRPVRFADGLAKLLESPECVLLEVSPGQILTRLARRQLPRTESQRAQSSLGSPDDERSESERLLTALGRLWLAGAQIDWSALASRRSGRRVPLPTYPFEHQRYWIDTPVGTGLSQPRGDPRAPMADWFYVPFWKPSALPRASAPANGEPAVERWLMLTRESDLGAQLGERLRHQGHEVVQVVPADRFERRGKVYGLRPDSAEDYKALLEDLADSGLPRLCLHSWSLSSTELAGSAPGDVASLRQLGHESLLLLGQALTEHATTEIRLTVVSDRLYQVDDNDLTEPEKALLLGPLRSLAREIPHLTSCHVDIIQPPSQSTDERVWLLDRLAAEAQFAAPQAGVAYRGRRRWTRAFEPFPLPSPAPGQQLRPRGVYLIVGDHGAIGLHIADFLGRSCQAQVIVLLPAPAPDPARWEGLEAEISVLAGDLPADEAIGTAVSGIEERFGPLNGVIHTALMSSETDEDLRQLGLQGLRALDLALAGRPLDFCCVCTPLAPFLGGAGSHAASAAGLFADAFVTERRGRSAVPWQNIVWDAWVKDGGTVRDSTAPDRTATDNAPKDREHDRHAMTAKDGVEVLRRALVAAEERQLVISTVALEPRLDSWLRGRSVLPLAEPPEPDEAASRPQLEADYVAPRNATEEAIVDLWSELLGFEQLGVDDNFFELGGDSLLATRLLSRLRQRFSAPLSLPAFFKAPTVAALAMEIAAHHLPAPPVEGAATSPIDEEDLLL